MVEQLFPQSSRLVLSAKEPTLFHFFFTSLSEKTTLRVIQLSWKQERLKWPNIPPWNKPAQGLSEDMVMGTILWGSTFSFCASFSPALATRPSHAPQKSLSPFHLQLLSKWGLEGRTVGGVDVGLWVLCLPRRGWTLFPPWRFQQPLNKVTQC